MKEATCTQTRIIIDSREQRAYDFDPNPTGEPATIIRALPAGDYSVEGLESRIAIERKSVDDFINTVLRSRPRFERELAKLQVYDFAAVVIESDLANIESHQYRSEIHPHSIRGIIVELETRYYPVMFKFGSDRPNARAYVQALLRSWERVCLERDNRMEQANAAA